MAFLASRLDIDTGVWNASLYDAAAQGHLGAVQFLLGHNMIDVDIDAEHDVTTNLKLTPMGAAAARGHTSVIKRILAWKDIMMYGTSRPTLSDLHCAAENGRTDTLSFLLDRYYTAASPLDSHHNADPASRGSTCILHKAVEGGHEDTVKMLLCREDIDPNQKTTFHRRGTPLSWAIFAGRLNIVQILLASPRVDPNARAGGQVPLAGAIKQKRWGIVRCLLDSPALDINRRAKRIWSSRLHADPNFEQLWLVELLLTRGLDPNVLDKSKKTILWHAVEANCQEVVDMLFAVNGEALDPNMAWDCNGVRCGWPGSDQCECCPLASAVEGENLQMVEKLLTHPAIGVSESLVELAEDMEYCEIEEMLRAKFADEYWRVYRV